jgi:hypothetical protein
MKFILLLLLLTLSGCSAFYIQEKAIGSNPVILKKYPVPDSVRFVGKIVDFKKGSCGVSCVGSSMKVKLKSRIDGLKSPFIYVIVPCLPVSLQKGIRVDMNAARFTGKESECYYRYFVKLDTLPHIYYRISEVETRKF